MKARLITLLGAALLLGQSRAAAAQLIVVSGSPAGTLTISSAVAGANPTPAINATTNYLVFTPAGGGTRRITARLDVAMPPGTTLSLSLAPPAGATGITVSLTAAEQDVVTGIPAGTLRNGLAITYQLDATPAAGVIAAQTRTITLKIQ